MLDLSFHVTNLNELHLNKSKHGTPVSTTISLSPITRFRQDPPRRREPAGFPARTSTEIEPDDIKFPVTLLAPPTPVHFYRASSIRPHKRFYRQRRWNSSRVHLRADDYFSLLSCSTRATGPPAVPIPSLSKLDGEGGRK